MIRRPQLKPCYRCEVVPSEGVFLLSEQGHFLLRGAAYMQVAPFLNGRHTVEEIIEAVAPSLSAAEVYYALELLRRKGYVVEATALMPTAQAVFWDGLEIDAEVAMQRLDATTVAVAAFGEIDTAPLTDLLALLGVRLGQTGERAVILTDDYLDEGLEAFNREALAQDRPWMLIKPRGRELWIGPVFIPGETGCWACLAHRLRGHRKVQTYLQHKRGTTDPFTAPPAALPSTVHTALGLAATEIARWLADEQQPPLAGRVVTLDALSLEMHHHTLVRRPQCPQCGDPGALSARQTAPLTLQSRLKTFTSDGGHRSCSPQETFDKLAHHISPVTGLVSRLTRLATWEDEQGLTPSYATDHLLMPVHEDLYFLRETLRAGAGGKGKRDIQARASALGETIERYSGIFQGDEARIHASLNDLGDAGIHPNACMTFSKKQIEHRQQWNASRMRSQWVPAPFDERRQIAWSPVWSLTCHEHRYVPMACCYYGYARTHDADYARANSNGCAAGNSKEEALLQGFMELVERDSVALWWYNGLRKPAVDLASFDDPYYLELLAFYQSIHRDLWVLDITSDLGIPTFAAISRRNDKKVEDIILGFGAHLDSHIALLRALTEANQSLPAVIAVSEEASQAYLDQGRLALEWWQTATLESEPYLAPHETTPATIQTDYPNRCSEDLYEDVMLCVRIAQEKGLETLVLDQTRLDTDLDVVKVIVPGLRHFWPRFGPGRLYDIPVEMNWLSKSLSEDELNPRRIYF